MSATAAILTIWLIPDLRRPSALTPAPEGPPDRRAEPAEGAGVAAFYLRVLDLLQRTGAPFLVGGGFAVERYTQIERDLHDFDVFVLPEQARTILERFSAAGHRT